VQLLQGQGSWEALQERASAVHNPLSSTNAQSGFTAMVAGRLFTASFTPAHSTSLYARAYMHVYYTHRHASAHTHTDIHTCARTHRCMHAQMHTHTLMLSLPDCMLTMPDCPRCVLRLPDCILHTEPNDAGTRLGSGFAPPGLEPRGTDNFVTYTRVSWICIIWTCDAGNLAMIIP